MTSQYLIIDSGGFDSLYTRLVFLVLILISPQLLIKLFELPRSCTAYDSHFCIKLSRKLRKNISLVCSS